MSSATPAADTVVAVATPPGTGALAIVRLSGPQSIAAVAACFRGADLRQVLSHTAHHGYIVAGGEAVDDVVVTVFRAPRSYTGEDCVEITCHGNPLLAARIVDTLLAGHPPWPPPVPASSPSAPFSQASSTSRRRRPWPT